MHELQATRRVRPLTGDDTASGPPAAARHPRAVAIGLSIAAAVIALDQVTKSLAEALLEPGVFVPLLGPHVGWQLVYNPGAAFGIPAPSWVFLVVTVTVVVIVLRMLPRAPSRLQSVALGLMLAGAIGNAIDRLVRPGAPGLLGGHVVDFVAWGTWPRFNVADSAITVAVVVLAVALWRDDRAAQLARLEPPAEGGPASSGDGDAASSGDGDAEAS